MLLYGNMSPKIHPLAPADPLEAVWRALSDPTRRAILDTLRSGPLTTGALADEFPQGRCAVMKHLDVLVASELVMVKRNGRERWNHLNPVPLQRMYERWVRPYEAMWAAPLVRLKDSIEEQHTSSPSPDMSPTSSLATPNQSAGVLTVQMEISIAAPMSRVWQSLTEDVNSWWPKDFLASVNPQSITLDAKLGGQLIERGENGGGVVWYTVYALVPGKSIDLVGQLSPAFSGPAQSLLRIELTEQGRKTVFALTDAVVGNVGLRSAEANESGWRAIFEHSFKSFVERI